MGQGYVTVHVIDTARGCNAGGIAVHLARCDHGIWVDLKTVAADESGRLLDEPLVPRGDLHPGLHEVRFAAREYFESVGLATPEAPAYIDEVVLRLQLTDADAHYHVPLALSPWGYTTFRGG